MKSEHLVLTKHAWQKARQYGLTREDICRLYRERQEEDLNVHIVFNKLKYGVAGTNVYHYWSSGYVFTIDEDRNVMITITRRERRGIKVRG